MHELSVCGALLDEVSRLAAQHGASAVGMVNLRLGPLSGVEPALLQAAYLQARRGTPAQDAGLVIAMVPLRIACMRRVALGARLPELRQLRQRADQGVERRRTTARQRRSGLR